MSNEHFGKRPVNGLIAWIALIIAIPALVLGWLAYNESSPTTVADQTVSTAEHTTTELRKDIELAQARVQLISLRAAVKTNENAEATADAVAEIGSDVSFAFDETGSAVSETTEAIGRDLQMLEQQIRENSADAADTLEHAIAALEAEIRSDN